MKPRFRKFHHWIIIRSSSPPFQFFAFQASPFFNKKASDFLPMSSPIYLVHFSAEWEKRMEERWRKGAKKDSKRLWVCVDACVCVFDGLCLCLCGCERVYTHVWGSVWACVCVGVLVWVLLFVIVWMLICVCVCWMGGVCICVLVWVCSCFYMCVCVCAH